MRVKILLLSLFAEQGIVTNKKHMEQVRIPTLCHVLAALNSSLDQIFAL
jgi:hypothetical protein